MNPRLIYSFPKTHRLLKRQQFRSLARHAERKWGCCCVLNTYIHQKRQQEKKPPRLGIAASTKYGNACRRNRFKRLAREAFRLCQHQFPFGLDLVIRPKKDVPDVSLQSLIEDLQTL